MMCNIGCMQEAGSNSQRLRTRALRVRSRRLLRATKLVCQASVGAHAPCMVPEWL